MPKVKTIWSADLPQAIRRARKALGLTQAELATKVLVSRYTVTSYERGHMVPSPPVLHLLSILLRKWPAEAKPILEALGGASELTRLSGRSSAIAEAIRGIRLRLRLTQTAFGQRLFIRQSTVSQYENGLINPGPWMLLLLYLLSETQAERQPFLDALQKHGELPAFLSGGGVRSAAPVHDGGPR